MNNYIVTGHGFVKDAFHDHRISKMPYIEYTDKIRKAKQYTSKQARNIIEKYGITGFVYNPRKEEPVRDMYDVKLQPDYAGTASIYKVHKAMMVHETDTDFLWNGFTKASTLYTEDDAITMANALNDKMITDIQCAIKLHSKLFE